MGANPPTPSPEPTPPRERGGFLANSIEISELHPFDLHLCHPEPRHEVKDLHEPARDSSVASFFRMPEVEYQFLKCFRWKAPLSMSGKALTTGFFASNRRLRLAAPSCVKRRVFPCERPNLRCPTRFRNLQSAFRISFRYCELLACFACMAANSFWPSFSYA